MTSALTPRGSTTAWRRLRAAWSPAVATGQLTCRRCGHPIHPGQPWDLGHLIDRAAGGDDRDVQPEHARCNRAASAHATNAKRRTRFSDATAPKTPRALSDLSPFRREKRGSLWS